MNATKLLLRKPVETDIESMYIMLKNSLSPYLTINNSSSKNAQLIIDKSIGEDYVKKDVYLCLVAEINSIIAGWLAGSGKTDILSEHSCSLGDFYIEEIVVDSHYRRKGVGSFLLRGIPKDRLKDIVVDTPLINKPTIKFYEKSGFVKVLGLSEEFYKTWTRMSKPV
ncbi:MAG: GNAT family N-acetyltransferase [Thermoplasmatales archaeon]|nr:GNAT family N-acetyltransferase [Thermoplasmatales archaeon]MCW6170311.1 GNAT family N-acetyltransferase [Thermoplasmatales archaeon]